VPHVIRSAKGSTLNLSSQAGKHRFPLRRPCAAATRGVIGLTEALVKERGSFHVRIKATCPALVEGRAVRQAIAGEAEASGTSEGQMTERLFAGISIKRFVPPEPVPRQVVFLGSPHARLIFGLGLLACGDGRMPSQPVAWWPCLISPLAQRSDAPRRRPGSALPRSAAAQSAHAAASAASRLPRGRRRTVIPSLR
jgi:hypothetical protein